MAAHFKVLLVYPALYMQPSLPLGIASMCASLKNIGVTTDIFDTSNYMLEGEVDENEARAIGHGVRSVNYEVGGIYKKTTNIVEDFKKFIDYFQPDLVGMSSTEPNFERGMMLMNQVKNISEIPTIVGGVFATLAPEIAIQEEAIDMICIGDGEHSITELCQRMMAGEDYSNVQNLWIKRDDKIIKNKVNSNHDLDDLVVPDFSDFNDHMFYRPMQGNFFKTVPVELARGCPYECAFCSEPALLGKFSKKFFRQKSIPRAKFELEQIVEKFSPEFIYFVSETFLAVTSKYFEEFIEAYKDIKIPFWIQTRVETITKKRLQQLQEVGLFWISIGIEHGNDEYRKEYVKRATKKKHMLQVMKHLDECGQGATLNSIIAYPHETEALVYDTIFLNREFFKLNNRVRPTVTVFTPFRGSEMYDDVVKNGMFEPVPYISNTDMTVDPLITSDKLTAQRVKELHRAFSLYVYLPDEYLSRVKLAEKFTEEGDKEFEILNQIVIEILDKIPEPQGNKYFDATKMNPQLNSEPLSMM